MLIDTHAHLNFSAYKDDLDEVVKRTIDDGMKVINVGSQSSTSQRAIALAGKYPGIFYAAVGLHPIHLFEMYFDESELPFKTRQEYFNSSVYEKLAIQPGVVAIGEVGIDYFHQPDNVSLEEFKNRQHWAFLKQLELAKKLNLPVILHCRSAKDDPGLAYLDMLAVVKESGYTRAVVHCFSSDWEIAKKFLDIGCLLSFTGIITYPKTLPLAEVVKKAPLDRIMVETDAPYLAPQLVRGQRNEPRFVRYVADRVAEIKNLDYSAVETATTQTAIKFFNLK